jgi:hypothetical protein
MRWSLPKDGEIREIKKFAWWPTRTSDNVVVWFEKFFIEQRFETWSGRRGAWVDRKATDVVTWTTRVMTKGMQGINATIKNRP